MQKYIWQPNKGAQYRAWAPMELDQLMFDGGRGSGKTSWGLGGFLSQVGRYGPSARGLILRRKFPDCREIITQGKEMFVANGMANYNAQDHIFKFTGSNTGATLEIGFLDSIDDYGRYHGSAFSYVLFDEITEFKSWDLVDRMGSTLRSKDVNVKPVMRFTGNPTGRMHHEVKKKFYDPHPAGDKVFTGDDGIRRMMVHSTVKDNPYLWENDPGYVKWLLSLPETLRKAWFEGCWDIVIGAFFSDVWDAKRHIIKLEPGDIPRYIPRYRAFDWGSTHPFGTLWYCIADGAEFSNGFCPPKGSIVFYDELYGKVKDGKHNEGVRWSSLKVAQAIKAREELRADHTTMHPGPADNQIFNDTDGLESSLYNNFLQHNITFKRSNKSPGTISAGLEQMRTRFFGDGERPYLYFSSRCTGSISTIPALVRHDTKVDELTDGQEDHLCDVVRYVCLDNAIDLTTPEEMARKKKSLKGRSPLSD